MKADDTSPPKPTKNEPDGFRFHNYEDRRVLSFLGLRIPYPRSFVEVLALALLFGLVGLVLYRVTDKDFFTAAKGKLFQFFEVSPDGKVKELPGYIRYGFWTPGPNTEKGPEAPPTEAPPRPPGEFPQAQASPETGTPQLVQADPLEAWEKEVTEKKLAEFGARLTTELHAQGYRRTEVVGYGRTKLKRGWWWIVTLPASVSPEELGAFYRYNFGTKKVIYLETLGESS